MFEVRSPPPQYSPQVMMQRRALAEVDAHSPPPLAPLAVTTPGHSSPATRDRSHATASRVDHPQRWLRAAEAVPVIGSAKRSEHNYAQSSRESVVPTSKRPGPHRTSPTRRDRQLASSEAKHVAIEEQLRRELIEEQWSHRYDVLRLGHTGDMATVRSLDAITRYAGRALSEPHLNALVCRLQSEYTQVASLGEQLQHREHMRELALDEERDAWAAERSAMLAMLEASQQQLSSARVFDSPHHVSPQRVRL